MAALPPRTIMQGNPPVPDHQPIPQQIVDWMENFESISAGGGLSYVDGTLAALQARAGTTDGQFGLVLNSDPESGVYERITSAWTKVASIPAIFMESLFADQAATSASAAAGSAAAAATSETNAASSASAAAGYASDAAAFAGYRDLSSAAALLADTSLSYGGGSPVVAGDVVRTRLEGFSYTVAASGASDHNLTTAGGVKLYVTPGPDGSIGVDSLGAVGDGLTDDTSVFQAVIDALPASGGIIEIGQKDYAVTTSALVVGSKTVIWTGNGVINSAPAFNTLPGLTVGINRNASGATETNQLVIARDDVGEQGEGAMLRLYADADYDSGGFGSYVSKNLEVQRIVGADANNSNWSALFDVTTAQSNSNARSLASYHKIRKTGNGKAWGLAISAISESLTDTQIVAAEVNARAIGSMGGNSNRIGMNCIVSTVEDEAKADFEAIINCVVNGTASGGIEGATGDLTADSKFGVKISEESPGQITNAGLFVETTGTYGVRIQGTQTASGLRFDGAAVYGIDLAAGTFSGSAIRVGDDDRIAFNNSGNVKMGWDATGSQLEVTAGANDLFALKDASDAFSLRVGGSLKQVTQGASDSGGSGFRLLRVPN